VLLGLLLLGLVIGLVLLVKRVRRLGFWHIFKRRQVEGGRASVVEFYERMTKALATRGLRRAAGETPLEFASATQMPEALHITRAYNRVRFGDESLSPTERARIEEWLSNIEGKQ
ncbi:MAG TPA: DUF4129 domain-containing protein, partial [Pyrinomonadaceae bacterium]|nr:DUF4129 domain-containing protein [Pyrinomonadaceae bacterium]